MLATVLLFSHCRDEVRAFHVLLDGLLVMPPNLFLQLSFAQLGGQSVTDSIQLLLLLLLLHNQRLNVQWLVTVSQ